MSSRRSVKPKRGLAERRPAQPRLLIVPKSAPREPTWGAVAAALALAPVEGVNRHGSRENWLGPRRIRLDLRANVAAGQRVAGAGSDGEARLPTLGGGVGSGAGRAGALALEGE